MVPVRPSQPLGLSHRRVSALITIYKVISAVRATEGRETGVYDLQMPSRQTQKQVEEGLWGIPDAMVCTENQMPK